jgi:hypothetical protein
MRRPRHPDIRAIRVFIRESAGISFIDGKFRKVIRGDRVPSQEHSFRNRHPSAIVYYKILQVWDTRLFTFPSLGGVLHAGSNGSFIIPSGKTPEYISGSAMRERRMLPGMVGSSRVAGREDPYWWGEGDALAVIP